MTADLDPVDLEVVRHQLDGIAAEMGRTLIRGAFSPNIKERQDGSTALFDAEGRLVAQVEHIPVHLGAMPDAVAAVRRLDPRPDEAYLLNDPFTGGTHLPDLTVVAPLAPEGEIVGYGAVRAHHADVGGATPGGLSARARDIYGEGIRIPPTRIVRGGTVDDTLLELVLANVRNPNHRRADLRAQLGAVELAERRLGEVLASPPDVPIETAYDGVIRYSRRRTRTAIVDLEDGDYSARDVLEGDGIGEANIPIEVTVTVDGPEMTVDFEGTAEQVAGNLNAPAAVTTSAVYFAVRCVTDPNIPPNHGCFEPISIELPAASILDPDPPAAVGGGNVETSQRVADVVLEACRPVRPDLPAHGQGTMNNLVIGTRDGGDLTYYETIGGGGGARPRADGWDGVHVGMTNTLNTPIETLEDDYPVLVERYALRPDSGGAGEYRGGLGIERALRITVPATVSILSDRRRIGPPGTAGGEAGTPGRNLLDGEPIGSKATVEVDPGTVVRVLTPGGGGYGVADDRDTARATVDRLDGKVTEDG